MLKRIPQSQNSIVVGDHVVAFLRQSNFDEKAAFFRTGTGNKSSQEVVRGVVTQIYRNGLAAISTNYQDGMHCFVNLSDVVKVLPKSHIPRHQDFAED